ncbi:MAG: ATP-dependent metallopeptidase FtsH/Yme1/Tma family protein [Alphaproteobacteria bacterium]
MANGSDPRNGGNGKGTGKGRGGPNLILWVVFAVAVTVALLMLRGLEPGSTALDVSYSQFLDMVDEGKVASVTFRGEAIDGQLREPAPLPHGGETSRFATRLPPAGDDELVETLRKQGIYIAA